MNPNLSNDTIREFVIAGHGNLVRVKQMLVEQPALLNASYEWQPADNETALQAAAHVGSSAVAEYLLSEGAPLDICTAAMLGHVEDVERFLQEDPANIQARGAHGISLLAHAALSGNVELAQILVGRGAQEGISYALSNAVSKGHVAMSRLLLETEKPDLGWRNFEGKTALEIATERNFAEIAELLRGYGAS